MRLQRAPDFVVPEHWRELTEEVLDGFGFIEGARSDGVLEEPASATSISPSSSSVSVTWVGGLQTLQAV